MAGLMGLFGAAPKRQRSITPRVQSSVEGRPRAVGAGQNRIAGNLIWYGDYEARPVTTGGKGAGASTGKGTPDGQQYRYSASFIVSIGEQIEAVQMISNGNQYEFRYTPPAALEAALEARDIKVTTRNIFGATIFEGDWAQTAWSYMTTAHPTEALNYRGESLACFANLNLGSSAALPNFNFEVLWALNTDVAAFGPDANPSDWVDAVLTNTDWGVGFPSVLLGDLTDYRDWARATSLLVSPLLDGQTSASGHLMEIMEGTIANFVWSAGELKVVPYADSNVSGNGTDYVANVTPAYDLTSADFLPVEHGPDTGAGPCNVKVSVADPLEIPTQISVQYLDRANLYNPVSLSDSDDAAIIASGRPPYPATPREHSFFCVAEAASSSASKQLRRTKAGLQTFYWRLPPQFILLDPMDIVTLTEPGQGLDQQGVRITEISKQGDGSLAFTGEEFFGALAPALYERQAPGGVGRNANAEPGDINEPVFIEPPESLGNGLKLWIALSGIDQDIWGGCNVWVCSEPDGTYQMLTSQTGNTRMGVTTDILPTYAEATTGQTIDSTNTLGVDLSMSSGELESGSLTDMTALNTICYLDGEIIAYQNATLTGTNAYDLEPMVRGAYETPISAHALGVPFVRLDNVLAEYPFDQTRVGSTLYFKFQSFNIYGGGLQDLADLPSYAYTIQGTAFAVPPDDVTNLRRSYLSNVAAIAWDVITDFRAVEYAIRRGTTSSTWDTAQDIGRVASPPFFLPGDGKYFVKAVVEGIPGLVVYSENATAITATGVVLPEYINASWDEPGTGWTGTVTGSGTISGSNFETTADNDWAYYEIPVGHNFDVLFDRIMRWDAEWQVTGVSLDDDFLARPDFLGSPMFSAEATALIDSKVELFIEVAGAGDVYGSPDVYAETDVYDVAGSGEWVKFTPGQQYGRYGKARLAIISYDPSIKAVATVFTNTVSVEARIDHIVNETIPDTGTTFTFTPDGSATAAAFNGGPNGATQPQVFWTINDVQDGDRVEVSAVSLSQVTITCYNGATPVERDVDLQFVGW